MIYYATLGSNNPPAAIAFYEAVLAPLGHQKLFDAGGYTGFGPAGTHQPGLWICKPFNGAPAQAANGGMLALAAETRAQVDAVHAAAMANGGSDEGKPGLREYAPNFYAAYFRDRDGNKLAIVCRAES